MFPLIWAGRLSTVASRAQVVAKTGCVCSKQSYRHSNGYNTSHQVIALCIYTPHTQAKAHVHLYPSPLRLAKATCLAHVPPSLPPLMVELASSPKPPSALSSLAIPYHHSSPSPIHPTDPNPPILHLPQTSSDTTRAPLPLFSPYDYAYFHDAILPSPPLFLFLFLFLSLSLLLLLSPLLLRLAVTVVGGTRT